MSQMDMPRPDKVFRGTVDEVFSHRGEIPPGATVELNVWEERPGAEQRAGQLGGKSLADRILEIGTVRGLPPDLSSNARYMEGFGETKNLRTLQP